MGQHKQENIATFLREETAMRAKPTIQSELELKAARINIRLARQGPNERLTEELAKTHKEIAEERGRIPLKDMPLYRQLRREDLHSKEFFAQLKPRRWKANVAELYRTRKWDAPVHSEHDTVTSDKAIRREFRKYYVLRMSCRFPPYFY